MKDKIVLNETSYFGWGSRDVLATEIKKRKYKKGLLVTDANLLKAGVTNKVKEVLDNNGIEYEVFKDVISNPTIATVKKGLKVANKYHVDFIIAVGGGSVIDTAKAIGIICTNPELKDVYSLFGVSQSKNRSLPIIALPTTAGSAAETTIFYDILDEEGKMKAVAMDDNSIPVLSIVDAELMAGMPISVIASTGIDALAQSIECYITKNHNEMSDMFALKAMDLIYNYLEKAANKDKDALEKMALGQYLSGMGFSNAGLGLCHAMAHQLSATYNIPQGLANSLLLPYILEFNCDACIDRYVDMANVIGIDTDGLGKEEIANRFVENIRELCMRLNIPQHISELGGSEEDIITLVYKTGYDPFFIQNPKELDADVIEELFKKGF